MLPFHIAQALGASFPLADTSFDSSSSDDESWSPRRGGGTAVGGKRPGSSAATGYDPPAAVTGLPGALLPGDTSLGGVDALVHIQSSSRANAKGKPKPQHTHKHQNSPAEKFSVEPIQPPKWDTRLADRATAAVKLQASYQLPPNVMFDLLADPRNHAAIFDAIESADAELLEEDGPRRCWRLDYRAHWHFWKVAGVCDNKLYMWTDRDAGTVTFKLREPGFLKRYEGTWTIAPPGGTPLSAYYASSTSTSSSPSGSPLSSRSSSLSNIRSSNRAPAHVLPMAVLPDPQVLPPLGGAAVRAIARMQAELSAGGLNLGQQVASIGQAMSALPMQLSQQLTGLPLQLQLPSLRTGTANQGSTAQHVEHAKQQVQLPRSSLILAETLTSPKITPPYPLNALLKGQAKTQVEEMLEGLVRAAADKAAQQAAQPHCRR